MFFTRVNGQLRDYIQTGCLVLFPDTHLARMNALFRFWIATRCHVIARLSAVVLHTVRLDLPRDPKRQRGKKER